LAVPRTDMRRLDPCQLLCGMGVSHAKKALCCEPYGGWSPLTSDCFVPSGRP
jgi:hypothetical protein